MLGNGVEDTGQEKEYCTESSLRAHFKAQKSYSEMSDIIKETPGTSDGCKQEGNSKNGFQWLIDLDNRESSLPNFWLILNVENDYVNVYFHCRYVVLYQR